MTTESDARINKFRRHWGGTYDLDAETPKLHLYAVRLNSGGYTSTGRYYGVGQTLYSVESADESNIGFEIRASDREHAKSIVRECYPKARFFR